MKKKAKTGKVKAGRKRSAKDLSAKKASAVKGGLLPAVKPVMADGSVRNISNLGNLNFSKIE